MNGRKPSLEGTFPRPRPSSCLTLLPPSSAAAVSISRLSRSRWINALRGAAHRDANDLSPLGSPSDGEAEREEDREDEAFPPPRVPTVATVTMGEEAAVAAAAAAAGTRPTSASEQGRIIDSLRQSFTSRRKSSKEDSGDVGGGSGGSAGTGGHFADVDSGSEAATATATGVGAERGTTKTAAAAAAAGASAGAREEGAARESGAEHTAGGGREAYVSPASSEVPAGAGGSGWPGVIEDDRRRPRPRSSSSSPGAPTEETGPAPTEEGQNLEDEEQAKSCVFQ